MKFKSCLLILFLLPFIIISFFNLPANDDFWNANTVIQNGRLGAVAHFYETVSGRYFSNFLMSFLNTLPDGKTWIFKIWPIVVVVLIIMSQYFFYKSIFQKFISNNKLLFAALIFTSLHIVNMRSLFEGLYWMSSTICYQIAIILFSIGIGSVFRYLKNGSVLYGSVATICSFLLPGTAESLAPAYLFTLLILLVVTKKSGIPSAFVFASVIVAATGICIVIFSKGNLERVQNDSLTYQQNILLAFFYSARSITYYSLLWLINPANFCLLLILLPYARKYQAGKRWINKMSMTKSILLLSFFFLLCISIYLPMNLFESEIPFPRVTSLFFFFGSYLFLLFTYFFLCKFTAIDNFINKLSSLKNYSAFLWLLFFAGIFLSKNFTGVVKDIFSGTAYHYNQEANKRFQKLKKSIGDTCYVSYYKYWPSSIMLFKNEDEDLNPFIHIDKYFGKTIIYAK
jgi:hypothetical protein